MGCGPAAAALIEEHDPILCRIVKPAHGGVRTTARPTVHDEHGLAVAVSALLEMNLVQRGDAEHTPPERFNGRIQAQTFSCRHCRQSTIRSPVSHKTR
jgi:hypothetical protein